ncbi:acyltransferase [Escherichia coli]|uniref:acyltransferase family protein n=1 Tax=Escherichia coli TaxID=562 RepID=UPI00225AC0C6|nr:acyltransferase [Escherichia coli]MCX3187238.1 acyltransferase [Escherichia coli]
MKSKYFDTDFITGLRAIAVMMVFLIHSGGGGVRGINDYLNSIVNSGRFGVQIFFVISGFTIFYQFQKAGYSYLDFLRVRFLRITTVYYPVLLIMFFIYYFKLIPSGYWNQVYNDGLMDFKNLFMHMSFFGFFNEKYINTILLVEWTLYIEMFFYIVLGFAIAKSKNSNHKFNISMFLCLSVVIYCLVYYLYTNGLMNYRLSQWLPPKYMVMFVVGGIACIARYKLRVISKTLSDLSFLIFISAILISPNLTFEQNEISFTLSTFLVITFMINESIFGRVLNNSLFGFLGAISFSFYLWHMSVLELLKPFNLSGGYYAICAFLISIVISYVSYKLFEVKVYSSLKNKYAIVRK